MLFGIKRVCRKSIALFKTIFYALAAGSFSAKNWSIR